jgi:hypothetical protein
MTALTIARREMPLDDLVVRVYHLELKECRDESEFKDAIQLVLRNLDEVMDTLGCYRPAGRRIMRAVEPPEAESVPFAQSLHGRSRIFWRSGRMAAGGN